MWDVLFFCFAMRRPIWHLRGKGTYKKIIDFFVFKKETKQVEQHKKVSLYVGSKNKQNKFQIKRNNSESVWKKRNSEK